MSYKTILELQTVKSEEFINITDRIQSCIKESKIKSGIIMVFSPHTTAGITINENADSDVVRDLLYGLNKIYPTNAGYKHFEGNSHAHLKASTIGLSQTIIIEDGCLLLGRWQSVYFCEFDGPRSRKVVIKIIED